MKTSNEDRMAGCRSTYVMLRWSLPQSTSAEHVAAGRAGGGAEEGGADREGGGAETFDPIELLESPALTSTAGR